MAAVLVGAAFGAGDGNFFFGADLEAGSSAKRLTGSAKEDSAAKGSTGAVFSSAALVTAMVPFLAGMTSASQRGGLLTTISGANAGS